MAEISVASRERFAIVRRLGAGGMGVVYEAFDRDRGVRVALKSLKLVEAGQLYRFKGEFRKLAEVRHKNLVRLHELFSIDDEWFFTMELVEGEPFITYVRGQNVSSSANRSSPTISLSDCDAAGPAPLPQREIDSARLRAAFLQLAEGVHALHRAGRLHRDLKPTNVLITRDGRVVICDFGLVLEPDEAGAFVTQEDRIVGTPAYMSPEQARRRTLTTASDWYSVGVMLYQVLTGRVPFSGSSAEVVRLKSELDPEPPSAIARGVPPDLDALCMRLLARAPEDRPSAETVLEAFGAPRPAMHRSRVPFVGRAAEIEVLRAALDGVRDGRAATWLVTGRSGVGKTAFVRHFLAELRASDAVILKGRCFERESVPYKAFDSLIDALSAHLLELPRGQAESLIPREVSSLVRLFPVLRRVDAVAEAPLRSFDAIEPSENRRRAVLALRELLARIAKQRLLVLAVDDLQWGDVDSAALLGALLRPPSPPPLLFIGCCRENDPEQSPFISALVERELSDMREIRLDPLPLEEARSMSLAVLPARQAELAETVARESGGNPFFIHELSRHVEAGVTLGRLAAPDLDRMLRARLAALPREALALLRIVAVAGRALPRRVAVRAADLPGGHVDVLDRLREERLVRAHLHSEALETWHDRVREAVVGSLDADQLRSCHAKMAAALRAVGDPDPQQLLDHLLAAGETDQAYRHAVTAASRAADALAFDRAARLFELALELAASAPAAETRELRRRMGDALASAGRGAESARTYLAAVPGADAAESLELRRRAAEQLLRSGYIDEGQKVLEGVLGDVGLRLPTSQRKALFSLIWGRLVRRLRGLRFRPRSESEIAPSMLQRLDVCWTAAAGLGFIDYVRSECFQTRHLLMALRAGEPYRVSRAIAMESVFTGASGRFRERPVAALLERASALAEQSGNAHARAIAIAMSGVAAFFAGRWSESYALLQTAEPILRGECTGVAWELTTVHFFSFLCLYYMGELGELSARVVPLLLEAEERSDLYTMTSLRTQPANIMWLAHDDAAAARREIDRAMRRWHFAGLQLQHIYELSARAQIDLYDDAPESAMARIDEKRAAIQRSLLLRSRNVRITFLHLEARASLALATRDAAQLDRIAVAKRAARSMRRVGLAWSSALASLVDAGAAAARGDAQTAASLFEHAEAACEAAGLHLFAAAARRRRGELEANPRIVSDADDWMHQHAVRNPARMTLLLAPGVRP